MTTQSDIVPVAHGGEVMKGGHPYGSTPIENTALLGMLLFIASEIMFFAGLFAAYFDIRARSLPHWPALPEGAEFGVTPVIIAATVVLVSSSAVIEWGVIRIRRGDRRGMNRAFALTVLMGITFLAFEAFDWYILGSEGVTLSGSVFGSLYFTMTGFHFAHVLGGVIGISIILGRGVSGQFSARHHTAVEAVSYYWHFVDVVWVLLFVTYYVLG
ncbi:MAG: cytochrome c oxidase subunit 3 [Candidatus Limnocylindrales bacterium]